MTRSTRTILIVLGVVGITLLVYQRVLSSGFVGFDDDMHVHANPFLNPPTLQSLSRLWQQPYEQLYVPLSYTIYAAIAHCAEVSSHMDSSLGRIVSLDPAPFHGVGVALHVANVLLCLLLLQQLTRRTATALIGSLVFALHPLQLETVGWISELRGLLSGFGALLALNALVASRQVSDTRPVRSRALVALSTLFVVCAMLCKPTAAVLPLVALAIDRVVLRTPWRRVMVSTSIWVACTLPFVWITHRIQVVSAVAASPWWQRPFIAGDALAFYLGNTLWPLHLGVDYGRTPRLVMANPWVYLVWLVPLGLLGLGYWFRQRRPLAWLGALFFVAFLLPTLGLLPFAYQFYSTVADRYAYLAIIGIGLVLADAADWTVTRSIANRVIPLALAALALLSFHQSRYWVDSSALLRHTIEINPEAAFAYYNLGDMEMANGDYAAALADYQACIAHDPTLLKTYASLAEVYSTLNRPAEAERAMTEGLRALDSRTDGVTADDLSSFAIALMKLNQQEQALRVFSSAVALEPDSPKHLFNQANALSAVGKFDQAEAAFRRCIAVAPTLAGAHTGLGIVFAETRRLADALEEFRTAVRLQPGDPAALDNLKRAEEMMKQGQ